MSRKHDFKTSISSCDDEATNIINSSNINSKTVMNTELKTFATDDIWDTPDSQSETKPEPELEQKAGGGSDNSPELGESAAVKTNNEIATSTCFEKMGIKENILRGLFAAGFSQPAPSQQTIPAALPHPITGIVRDVILAARAGSGKTLYFGVVGLNSVDTSIKKLQVIVVSPTRELASQTFTFLCSIADFSNVSIALHRGVGNKTKKEGTAFTRGVNIKSESYISYGKSREGDEQIIVATPGRLQDILTNERGVRISATRVIKKIDASFVRLFVADEADELLSPKNDFQETLAQIFKNIPTIEFCQKMIVSATITDPVLEICRQILQDPIQILVKKDSNISSISHYYVGLTNEEDKSECLLDIYANGSIETSIIFANTAIKAEYIYNLMKEKGFCVGFIHAKLSMSERDKIMNDFRKGIIRVLVGTDLIARGIDVQTVSIVFNYDLPPSLENYIHRVGRCGRYGRRGIAINFVIEANSSKPKDIVVLEKYFNVEINHLPNLDILKF
jgi:ATP-dependent RNA helicase